MKTERAETWYAGILSELKQLDKELTNDIQRARLQCVFDRLNRFQEVVMAELEAEGGCSLRAQGICVSRREHGRVVTELAELQEQLFEVKQAWKCVKKFMKEG